MKDCSKQKKEHMQRLRAENVSEELKEVHIIRRISAKECRNKLEPNHKGSCQHVCPVDKESQRCL